MKTGKQSRQGVLNTLNYEYYKYRLRNTGDSAFISSRFRPQDCAVSVRPLAGCSASIMRCCRADGRSSWPNAQRDANLSCHPRRSG